MKKILITANTLDYGGIETSLITFLNLIDYSKYDVTLLLEEKKGIFLKDVPAAVKVIDYKLKTTGLVLARKIYNRLNLIKTIIKYRHKFDVAISYTTYNYAFSIIVRRVCKKNYLWVHSDYTKMEKNEGRDFYQKIKAQEFQNIVFVSARALTNYQKVFAPQNKLILCRNYIDLAKINKLVKEKITYQKQKFTFINVGRHDDKSKKLGRIIEASQLLKKKGYDFAVLFIGDGPDHDKYQKMVQGLGLEGTIKFFGFQQNPYPYYKIADAVVITSDWEGYPVVFSEALALNKPIITTDVSDASTIIGEDYGIITSKRKEDIALAMEKVLTNQVQFKKFDIRQFNAEISKTINHIIGD